MNEEINLKKLPKKIRLMNKDELIKYINEKIKLENDFLYKLDLEEIQLLLIQLKKYGKKLGLKLFKTIYVPIYF